VAKTQFPIKGYKEGLLIKLGEGNWKDVQADLLEQIEERKDFFQGAKIAIDVDERVVRAVEMGAMRDVLSERGVNLFAVISKSSVTDSVAESLGLSTHKTILREKENAVRNILADGENAVLIRKTLRSGTSIKYPGHVLVEGDVNPGAEILAGGSIYIWGKLRGSAYAGIEGSEKEVICALELNPAQLRIANIAKEFSRVKIKIKKKKTQAQKAMINLGEIRILDWEAQDPLK
jgi:septum site-determining protein MinC